MTSEHENSPLSEGSEAVRERIGHLLTHLFQGNQHRMAAELRVSQSLISKVLRGERMPGRKLVQAIVQHPRIRGKWLLYGDGDPLLPSLEGTLPVSRTILPGPPGEASKYLHGERHPVTAQQDRETRYWLRLDAYLDTLSRHNLQMLPGDLLLTETAPDHLDRPDLVDGRLCLMRFSTAAPTYDFAAVTRDSDHLLAERLGAPLHPSTARPAADGISAAGRLAMPRRRSMRPSAAKRKEAGDPPAEKRQAARDYTSKSTASSRIVVGEGATIVGLVLQLVRPDIRLAKAVTA